MIGTFYMAGAVFGLILLPLNELLVSVASLPGSLVFIGTGKSRARKLGIVAGFILALIGQVFFRCAIAGYMGKLATFLIDAKNGWFWPVWIIAFLGTAMLMAQGSTEAFKTMDKQPELRQHPMYLANGWSWFIAIAMFVVFAVAPQTLTPIWSWLPYL